MIHAVHFMGEGIGEVGHGALLVRQAFQNGQQSGPTRSTALLGEIRR